MIPPEHSAEFVVHMEDVLEIYHRPYEPNVPMICVDWQFTTADARIRLKHFTHKLKID